MNRYQKLLSNTGLIALGSFGSKLIVFFMVRFYTACLTKEQLSTADLIMDTAKLLMPMLCLGIAEGVFRFGMDEEGDKRDIFTVGLLTVLGGFVLFVPVIPLLWATDFAPYTGLIAAYVLCANLHSMVSYYIRTRDHFRFYAIQGILNTSLVVGFNLLFLLGFGWKVEGYVLSVILADFLTFCVIFLKEKLWTEWKHPKTVDRTRARAMLRYSLPLIPTTIFWWITSVSDRFMVKWMVGDAANGLYTAANKIPTVISLLCTVFIQAWNFSSVAEKDEAERSRFFTVTFSAFSGLLLCAAAGVILCCQGFSALLFARDYFPAWQCIPVLTLATIFSSFVSFTGSMYTVRKKSMAAFGTAAVGAGVNLLMNCLLIPKTLFGIPMAGLGAIGAAIATVLSYFAVFLIRAITVKKYVPFRLGVLRLTASFALLGTMAGLLLAGMPSDYGERFFPYLKAHLPLLLLCAGLAAAVIALNAIPLLRGLRGILKKK